MPRPYPPYLNLSFYAHGLNRGRSELRLEEAIRAIGGQVNSRIIHLPNGWLGRIGHDSLFSEQARQVDCPAVCLLLEAETTNQEKSLRKLFFGLLAGVSPDYAGWATEQSLPCAEDLEQLA